MPQVSVVIPAYNAMAYLPETLDSVFKQTFTDFEVLIIDDGSQDHIREWASQLSDQRVRLISQNNQGLSAARNTGIAHAQGDYIAFLDADDLWEATKLEKQVLCLDNNPSVGLVHTWMMLIDEHGKSTGRVMKSHVEGYALPQILESNKIACPSVIVRRCCFEKVGVFDCNLRSIEDWDMWIRIGYHYPFAVIPEPLAYYRQLSGSMSKNWVVMEEAFDLTIKKAYNCAPPELMYLKNRSYGYANLCLSWKALQSRHQDCKTARKYLHQAIAYYPQLKLSSEYIRLSLAIALMDIFGNDSYQQVLALFFSVRRFLSRTKNTLSRYKLNYSR